MSTAHCTVQWPGADEALLLQLKQGQQGDSVSPWQGGGAAPSYRIDTALGN